MAPLVSVIVPLYNYARFIGDCLRSILAQSYRPLEVIVVDDGSSDDSAAIAGSIVDSRLKLIALPGNRGYSTAKNEGIIASQGELITTLDADDLFTTDAVAPRVSAVLRSGADWVHAKAFDFRGSVSWDELCKSELSRSPAEIHAQTVMLRRSVYQRVGLYDESLVARADKEMWHRLGFMGFSPVFVDCFVAYYRRHPASMMSRRHRNRVFQAKVLSCCNAAIKRRDCEGINADNTRMLLR